MQRLTLSAENVTSRETMLTGPRTPKCQLSFGVMDSEDQDLVMREVKVSRGEIGQVAKLHGRILGQMTVPGSVTVQESPVSSLRAGRLQVLAVPVSLDEKARPVLYVRVRACTWVDHADLPLILRMTVS